MEIQLIYNTNHPNSAQIEKTCGILNTVQRYFYFKTIHDDGITLNGSECDAEAFLNNHFQPDKYKIFITNKQFRDNWFSHEGRTCSIITTNNWEELYSPPSVTAYIMYQCAQSALGFAAELSENTVMNFIHYKPEGCMFDLCIDKKEIKLGMISGVICPICRATLLKYGTDELAIVASEQILSYVRSQVIGKPLLIENKAFVVMRFSENDENDHAYKYGIKPAFLDLNINESRADSKYESRPLLEKIKKNIEICRFIVAKVDQNNLNVFFELGLAMGLSKDVLLISEESLVIDLPTDLKNWECLTYPKGNYEELRKRIKDYYKASYHL